MSNKENADCHPQDILLFDQIAYRYDFLNYLFSFGIHKYWESFLVRTQRQENVQLALDLCTGTGATGFAFLAHHPDCKIIGLDLSENMLSYARNQIEKKKLNHCFSLLQGDGLRMPFPDNHFDIIFNSFGLRNQKAYPEAFLEMARVLKPEGSVNILEFNLPSHRLFRKIYLFYLSKVMPAISHIFLKDRHAFDYLSRTIREFPSSQEIVNIMRHCGFYKITVKPLSCGIVNIYRGYLSP